jgi:hypothetical protein
VTIEDLSTAYRAALVHEKLCWAVAWLPINETICGIDVVPLTPRCWLTLEVSGSPWIVGGVPELEHVFLFLWAVSPHFGEKHGQRRFYQQTAKALKDVKMADIVAGISGYLSEAFADSLGASGKAKRESYSFVVDYAFLLGSAYNVTPQQVLDMPFKQIFQLLKPVAIKCGRPLCNPSDSDRARLRSAMNEEKAKA